MPGINVHLAIAKMYLQNNKGKATEIQDEQAFFDGNVLPDLTHEDKESTHYGKRGEMKDMVKRSLEKVDLGAFLESNPLDSDTNRGKFLHLITDWEFYNNFLCHDYLSSVDHHQFSIDMAETCFINRTHTSQKYGVGPHTTSYQDELVALYKAYDAEKGGRNGRILYTNDQLDLFIEKMGQIDLENCAKNYAKHNI